MEFINKLKLGKVLVVAECMHPPLNRPHPQCEQVRTLLMVFLALLVIFLYVCDQIAQALVQCHDDNPFGKLWHICGTCCILTTEVLRDFQRNSGVLATMQKQMLINASRSKRT
jgi:hypothetical protein